MVEWFLFSIFADRVANEVESAVDGVEDIAQTLRTMSLRH